MGASLVSVVVPCHNETLSLPVFLDAVEDVAARAASAHLGASLELIMVDDGSTDATLEVMRRAADTRETDSLRIRWLSFSRNFGKEAALLAGLRAARGDFVAVMDADMQDPPELLLSMLDLLLVSGGELDCVAARRVSRAGEPRLRALASGAFYGVMRRLTGMDIPDGARDFRLMTRPMVDAVLSMPERSRFTKGILAWVGFRTAWLEYEDVERAAGTSNWSVWQLFAYAFEGIVAFSTVPLAVASVIGVLLALASVVALLFIVVRALLFGDPVAGWPSLACIVIFIGGLQLMGLGIIGQYLAKTYTETKRRPLYFVRSSSDELP